MMRTVLLFIALTAVASTSAWAGGPQGPTSGADSVQLSVVAIEMSKGAASVDPRLNQFKKYFTKSFRDYTTFRFLSTHDLPLSKGKSSTQNIAGKRLEATYLGRPDKLMRVEVKFDGARMTMKVRDSGLWFHAGRRARDGKVTVLALRARLPRP